MTRYLTPLLLLAGLASPASAGSVTATLQITVQAPLAIVVTPANPTLTCTSPAGTVVAALSLTGGDGNPATFAATAGDTSDFGVTGSNVVVGSSGIAAANCGKTNNLTITVTQP